MIGIAQGTIGGGLHQARTYLLTADVFAWTIAIVLLSMAMEKLFRLLVSRWRGGDEANAD
jgi:NitT/TauT family transport system permease protein